MSINSQQLKALLDLSVTSSANGATIPIPYGTIMCDGNIIWSPGLTEKITPIPTKDSNDVTHTLNYYSNTVSMAVAFCEGPAEIIKIWGDNTVLYDNSAAYVDYQGDFNSGTVYNVGAVVLFNLNFYECVRSVLHIPFPSPGSGGLFNGLPVWQLYTGTVQIAGGQQFPSPTIYTGSDTQGVDPTILAALGPDKASAFRGVCYAVWTDLDVTNFNNAIPSIRAVVKSGTPGILRLVVVAAANASGGNTVYKLGGTPPAVLENAWAGFPFDVEGFGNSANNGVYNCVANNATTITLANPSGVAQSGTASALCLSQTNLIVMEAPSVEETPLPILQCDRGAHPRPFDGTNVSLFPGNVVTVYYNDIHERPGPDGILINAFNSPTGAYVYMTGSTLPPHMLGLQKVTAYGADKPYHDTEDTHNWFQFIVGGPPAGTFAVYGSGASYSQAFVTTNNNTPEGASGGIDTSGIDYIVNDTCKRSGLDPAAIDVDDLTAVANTAIDVYQSDGSGIPALTLTSGGTVNFYQGGGRTGAPFEFTFPNTDSNTPLPAPKFSWKMPADASIIWNPYPADATYPGYTTFLPGWTTLNSYDLIPMTICGVVSGGGFGAATYSGNAYAPFTPSNVGGWTQANWNLVQSCKINVAVAGDYTFKCSSNDAVVIGIGGGAIRVSGPLVFSTANGAPSVLTKTALNGYPVMMAENVDMGEHDDRVGTDPHTGMPYLDATLSTFVVHFPTAGVYPIEVDYGCHVDARTLCLNWMNNGVQSPLLPVAGTDGADGMVSAFGYIIKDQKDGKSIIKDLQDGFFFDMAESDFKLKFIRRGVHPSVMTVPQLDQGMKDDKRPFKKTLTQEQDAPRLVVCNYLDPSIDYQQGSQQRMRSSRVVKSLNETKLDLTALSLSSALARQIADKSLYTTWMERVPYELNLWKAFYSLLDPTDTIGFVSGSVINQQRLKKISVGQDFSLKAEGVSQLAAAYTSSTVGAPFNPVVVAVTFPWLELESGGLILLESGSKIIMEMVN